MNFIFFIQLFILVAGVIDDLRSRKVHNVVSVSLALLALTSTFYLFQFEGLKFALLSSFVALGVSLPLVMAKILGAGDMKLLFAFSLCASAMDVFWISVYALIWGALLGLFISLLQGKLLQILKNTVLVIARTHQIDENNLTRIPYTVAIFLGWLTQLSFHGFHAQGVL